jgi:hypothetical protein
LLSRLKRKVTPTIPMAGDDVRRDFYARGGLKSIFDYLGEAKQAHGLSQVLILALAGRIIEATASALQYLNALLSLLVYDFAEAFRHIDIVQHIGVTRSEHDPVWK